MPPTAKRTTTARLGHHEKRYWPADPTAPPGGQRGGAYEVFIPEPIAEREFTLDSGAVAEIAEATKALGHLNDTRPRLASLAALARNLLRSEKLGVVVHAQFENIHPFADGNGRTGRALIYTVLYRRGEISNYVPPISLVLVGQPKNYVGGLGAYSQGEVGSWCERFAFAAALAAREAEGLALAIEGLQVRWLERLGQPRRDAAVREIVSVLPAQPVIDVPAAQRLTGKSHVAIGNAVAQLEEAGVLQKLNERKWGRLWECGELFALVETFERNLSTPFSARDRVDRDQAHLR